MLKLVTGLPGDGKTSNELWDFLHADQYKGRPKFCTPIKGFDPQAHGVTPIEHIKDWQELPEGAAIFCDEVQNYCGTDLGREAPDWVKQLALHRHEGKDFVFTTQSPMFIHPFARKLVKPHVHYLRPWNMKGVRYTWDSVQTDPASRTAKNMGQSQLVKTDPKVFTIYTSTVLDTHKAKPPYKLLAILAIAAIISMIGFFFAARYVLHLTSSEPVAEQSPVTQAAVTHASAASIPASSGFLPAGENKPVWTEENLKPRLPGTAYSAPIFDSLTAPTDFPRVAACMSSESRGTCNCYTQQGTPLDVPESACLVFIKHGSFDYWLSGRKQQSQQQTASVKHDLSPPPATKLAPNHMNSALPVLAETSSLFANTKDANTGRP